MNLLWFQEIQKIVVFEGAFEKIFSIIKEEGGSDGGVVVQVIHCDWFYTDTLLNLIVHCVVWRLFIGYSVSVNDGFGRLFLFSLCFFTFSSTSLWFEEDSFFLFY